MAKISLKGLKKTMRTFKDIEKRMKEPKKVNGKMASMAYRDVMEHFDKQEGGDGKKWPKWTRMTKSGRKVYSSRPTKRGGNKLLKDLGNLRGGIRPRSSNKAAEVFVRTTYGQYHQTGTSKMARRKFMWLGGKARVKIASVYGRYIARGR